MSHAPQQPANPTGKPDPFQMERVVASALTKAKGPEPVAITTAGLEKIKQAIEGRRQRGDLAAAIEELRKAAQALAGEHGAPKAAEPIFNLLRGYGDDVRAERDARREKAEGLRQDAQRLAQVVGTNRVLAAKRIDSEKPEGSVRPAALSRAVRI